MIAKLSFFIEKIYNHCIVLLAQWYTNFLSAEGVHPESVCFWDCWSFAMLLFVYLFQRTHFFHWLPWQMPHQRFHRFDSLCCYFSTNSNTNFHKLLNIWYVVSKWFGLVPVQKFCFRWFLPLTVINPRKAVSGFGKKSCVSTCFSSIPQNPDFERPWQWNLLKILWEKEKMLVTSIFSFSHNIFYHLETNLIFFSHFYIVVCICFQFGPVWKFVVW